MGGKVLTTPGQPDKAVEAGVRDLLDAAGVSPRDVSHVVDGTTLLINALIERKGARTVLVTTKGYRDAIEIGREHRYDMYDLFMERPAPLAPRELRFELDERILADGSIHRLLKREEVTRLIETLRADGIEALAVCLLHKSASSESSPASTPRRWPVRCPCEVVPEIRECDRASTTLVNVYIQRIAKRYLASLEARLQAIGVERALFIMQSNGGVCDVETARRFHVRLAESGPAAGALAAAHYLGSELLC